MGAEILKLNYQKIQKINNKGRRGDLVTNVDLEVEKEIKDFISQGAKINAIKHYRNTMKRDFNTEISLRLAKDTIDALADNIPNIDLTTGYNNY